MEIIFTINLVVCMGQIWVGERKYTHRQILVPCFIFSLMLFLFLSYRDGWELASIYFVISFALRFFVESLRFSAMIYTGTEIGSQYYWRWFACCSLGHTALLFMFLK